MTNRYARLAALVLATVVAGCGDGTAPAPTTTTTNPTTAAPAIAVDWRNPGTAVLPDGWGLADCPGDAPLVCVARGGSTIGQLEILSFPVDSLSPFATTLAKSGAAAALDEHARNYIADFTADRTATCGSTYRVTPDGPVALTAKGQPAVRYGFAGTLGDGRPSERVLQYGLVRGRDLVLLSATASDQGGCLPDEGRVFTTDELTRLAPVLDQVVQGSGLPSA